MFRKSKIMGKARCEIGWNWHPQPMTDYDLWYVMDGSGTVKLDGESYEVDRGSCFLFRPGDLPSATQQVDHRLTVIFVHFTVDSSSGLEKSIPPRYKKVEQVYRFEQLLEQLIEQASEENAEWMADQFDAIIRLVWLQLLRESSNESSTAGKHQALIARVKMILHGHGGRRVPNEEIASELGLSAEYLSMLFKKYTRTSIKQYTTDVRLERAMYLLTETTMNVTQTAEALGYSNIYLFSKQFKERYGDPPSHFQWKGTRARPHY